MKALIILFSIVGSGLYAQPKSDTLYVRTNLVGYLPEEEKVGVAFSTHAVSGKFNVINILTGKVVFTGKIAPAPASGLGGLRYFYHLDFSALQSEGTYRITLSKLPAATSPFTIAKKVYGSYAEDLLGFMRQQRCGYNPFFNQTCHEKDGRTMDGPMPDSTYLDARGGWHGAGDQLKYLITASNAVARMMMAYQLFPEKFTDQVNGLGQPGKTIFPMYWTKLAGALIGFTTCTQRPVNCFIRLRTIAITLVGNSRHLIKVITAGARTPTVSCIMQPESRRALENIKVKQPESPILRVVLQPPWRWAIRFGKPISTMKRMP